MIKHLCKGKSPGDRLFDRKSYKKPSKAFKRAAKKVVQQGLKFYSLRHSCGVYWRRQGVPLSDIQELLRHSSEEMTKIDAALGPGDLGSSFERAYNG